MQRKTHVISLPLRSHRRAVVDWLRSDYQIPKLGYKVTAPDGAGQVESDVAPPQATEGKLA